MSTVDRYVAAHVVVATLLALAALLALVAFVSFVDDLDAVGRGDYTVGRALEYMVLTMPRRAFVLMPLAAVIGALMGLGLLAATSELAVMRASGVSVGRLAGAVLGAGAVLVLLALVLGELLAPPAERLAQERRALAISGRAMHTGAGFWLRDGNSFIHVGSVLPGRRLADVLIYELDGRFRLRVATAARLAVHTDEGWRLEDLRQSRIDGDRVTARTLSRARWDSVFQPELVSVVSVKPESLSVLGLLRYVEYLRANDLTTARFELALWTKVAYPLATGVMLLLALPLVLARPRAPGLGQRILVGALIGIGFHVLNQMSGHLGIVYGVAPALSAFAPTGVFLGVAVALLRRVA